MRGELPAYLSKDRHGLYNFRARIPKRFQLHFNGKAEIKRSLGTDSYREAVKLARSLRVQMDQRMAELEKGVFRSRVLVLEGKKRITLPDGTEETITARIERDEPATEAEKNEHKDFLLRQLDREAAFKLDQVRRETLHGAQLAQPNPTREKATREPPAHPVQGLLLSTAIQEYIADKTALRCWKPRSATQVKTTLRDFLEIVGDRTLASITKKIIADCRQTLARLPANRNKLKQYRDKSIADILAMPDVKPIDTETVKNNLGRVSPFFAWCVEREYITTNPANAITKPLPKWKRAKDARDPFTPEELRALFHSDEYKSFREPYQYWVPIIGLYTGARLEEICKLKLTDIKQIDGIWCIAIEDAKTKAGWRKVPIHKKLIALSLLDYVSHLKASGNDRLFPELSKGRDGYGARVSKWFARYRHRCGIEGANYRKCFHSFRHTFKDWLQRKHRVEKPRIQALIGHEPSDVTDKTYGFDFTPSDLKPDIDLLDFELNHPPFR